MNSINLKSIKHESIRTIFAAVADTEKTSRAAVSSRTGLSLVTVGKIADALLEQQILSQTKEARPQAGRRAGLLRINEQKYALILDTASRNFQLYVLNLRLEIMETQPCPPSCMDDVSSFFAFVLSWMQTNRSTEDCFGIGLLVSEEHPEDADQTEKSARDFFPDLPLAAAFPTHAAAAFHVSAREGYSDKSILYWYVSPSSVRGLCTVKGHPLPGLTARGCDFADLLTAEGRTLGASLADCPSEDVCALLLAEAACNVLHILHPHVLLLEYDLPFPCDSLTGHIRSLLLEQYGFPPEEIPDTHTVCGRGRCACRGLALRLRGLWLDRLVFDSDHF